MYILSLTSFFDCCIYSWEVYAKVFSGATVSLQKRRGGTGGGRERKKVTDRGREKEGEIPHLTGCLFALFAVAQL